MKAAEARYVADQFKIQQDEDYKYIISLIKLEAARGNYCAKVPRLIKNIIMKAIEELGYKWNYTSTNSTEIHW